MAAILEVSSQETSPPKTETMRVSATSWAQQIVRESLDAKCTSIGLCNGSRHANDRRAIDALARLLCDELAMSRPNHKMLILRLDVVSQRQAIADTVEQMEKAPLPTVSPLGPWSELTVQVPISNRAGWALEHLPHWLPEWKRMFQLLLVDLGPMSEVPSRIIGRLCDGCYVLLGPGTCASPEWILQHTAWHDRSGSAICGTLLVK